MPPSSPRILDCRWGRVRIDGFGVVKDAKLFPGGARAWDWGETGTRHRPGIQPADVAELVEHAATTVILSSGVLRMLGVCPETLRQLEDRESPSWCCRRPRRSKPTIGWWTTAPPWVP